MFQSELKLLAAYHVLGLSNKEDVFELSHKILDAGIWADGFVKIICLRDPIYYDDYSPFVVSALSDFGIDLPDADAAIDRITTHWLRKAIEGTLVTEDAFCQLRDIILRDVMLGSIIDINSDRHAFAREVAYFYYRYDSYGYNINTDDTDQDVASGIEDDAFDLIARWCRKFGKSNYARTFFSGVVNDLAESIRTTGAFDRLPILADALEEAGCDNAEILDHCRSNEPHVRACWVVDLILDNED